MQHATLPRAPRQTSTASPAATGTIGPSAPDRMTSPAFRPWPRAAIVRASQYAARRGWPMQAAPLPTDTTSPLRDMRMPTSASDSAPSATG